MLTLQITVFLAYAMLVAVLFAVLVPGYLAWLWWGRRGVHPFTPPVTALPPVDVLVPTRDEVDLIEGKLDNLAALDYPRDRLRILVVDGASTDGTWERVVARSRSARELTPIRLATADKTRQLNVGLQRCEGSWVVVTDADARLPPEALRRLVAVGEADPAVAVVGTEVIPERAHALERLHWRLANLIRRYESDRGSSSLVAGPCYAFRRTLLARFPDDVVADDAYVALTAAASAMRVALTNVRVVEKRSPLRLGDLLRHKLRKTDAYLREVFRFLPLAGRMPAPARVIFLWRAAHLTVLPVVVTLGSLGAALALPGLPHRFGYLLSGVAVVLFLASWWGLGRRSSPLQLLAHGLVLSAVTLAALVCYPFSRQTANLPKVVSGRRVGR